MKPETLKRRERIAKLYRSGKTPKDIAKILDIQLSTVYFRINRERVRPSDFLNRYNIGRSKQRVNNEILQKIKSGIKQGELKRRQLPNMPVNIRTPLEAQIAIKREFGVEYSIRTIQKWFKEAHKNRRVGRILNKYKVFRGKRFTEYNYEFK